jgi:hypothetical protein
MHMLEIANSARQPWVAYGDNYTSPSISILARHFRWGPIPVIKAQAGNVARTELGSKAPSNALTGITDATTWSGQKFMASAKWDFRIFKLHARVSLFWFVALDSVVPMTGTPGGRTAYSYFDIWHPNWWQTILVNAVAPGQMSLLSGAVKWANQKARPTSDVRPFILSPYVSFAARAGTRPGLGPTGALGNFAQPDVLVGLAKEGRDYNAEAGAARYYGHRFSWNGKGAGSGATDFSYTNDDWPQLQGMPRSLQVLHKGLNAFSAAQVYYHRPGDWREQPNFFNPLWGARLMPVSESNVWQKLGFGAVPILKQLVLH